MITIKKSPTADTRTCDFSKVSKERLLHSSKEHIGDVDKALMWMCAQLETRSYSHDHDKISGIDQFHADFVNGFEEGHTNWWDNHRKVNRHHLNMDDGVPDDVNLFDVLEMIADCGVSGMARSGSVYPMELDSGILQQAVENTMKMLVENIEVEEDDWQEPETEEDK